MKKFWNWINQTETETKERVLELNGTIAEESWFDDDITPRMFKDELFSETGPITIGLTVLVVIVLLLVKSIQC